MSIPAIEPYPMPVESELPANRAHWQPDPRRIVLLIHDMQRYFIDFLPARQSPRTALVANARALRERASMLDIPVVYTAQPGAMTRVERGLLRDIWGPGMSADPGSRQIIEELTPSDRDVVLTKWRYSAFHGSALREVMGRQDRDQLVICGIYAHVGVLMTALDSFSMDIETFVVTDAVADFSAEEHRMALWYAANRCAVTLSTASLLDKLSEPANRPVAAADSPS